MPGNCITLLENGEAYFPRVFDAIIAAEHEVLLETFILFNDKVGRDLQRALLHAAARGAEVHVLIDGWGSPDLPSSFTKPLLDAGVRVRIYEPVQRLFGFRVNMLRRMHRKLVVVDGKRAFVGGINYSVDHLSDSGPLAKQDYAVEIEGPLVGQIRTFCHDGLHTPQPTRRSWLQHWRERHDREDSRTKLDAGTGASAAPAGARAAFVTRDNRRNRSDIEHHYRAAVRSATSRVLIANAYFFPGYRLLRDLRQAARRGVQVELILQDQLDMPWAQGASELLYAYLIRAGVRVYEYSERPLHGKVAVVDDDWATVGSSNLDPTSLSLNLEANVVVRDETFAKHLRERIEHLMQQRCELVQLPIPGPLRSAWIVLRNALVYHAMRHFAALIQRAPESAPRVMSIKPKST